MVALRHRLQHNHPRPSPSIALFSLPLRRPPAQESCPLAPVAPSDLAPSSDMAAMASLACATVATPAAVSFSGLRPQRRLAHVAACPPLRLLSLSARPGAIRASQDKEAKDAKKGDTFSDIQAIIMEQLGVDDVKEITPDSTFTDLGADSLDTVEIMMALEEKFSIELDQEAGEHVKTVQHAVDLINEKVQQKK